MEMQSVEVFAVGTWNRFKFVEEDLQEIVNNTTALMTEGRLKAPIKLGHSNAQILKGQTDGDPSLGWITAIRKQGDKIVADFSGIPEILFNAIEQERYKQVSVELKHTENFGWFMTAVALLGSDLPAVRTLDDLQAFLSVPVELLDNSADGTPAKLMFSEPSIIHNSEIKGIMSEETKDLTVEFAQMQSELAQLKKEKEALELQNKVAEFSSKKSEILAVYKKDIEAGKLMPAALDKIELSIDSQKQSFLEGEEISFSAEFVHSLGEFYTSLNQKEQATGEKKVEMSADEALTQEVLKVVKNTGKSFLEASEVVFSADQNLLEDYKNLTIEVHGA